MGLMIVEWGRKVMRAVQEGERKGQRKPEKGRRQLGAPDSILAKL
jgi:hypothetical protein